MFKRVTVFRYEPHTCSLILFVRCDAQVVQINHHYLYNHSRLVLSDEFSHFVTSCSSGVGNFSSYSLCVFSSQSKQNFSMRVAQGDHKFNTIKTTRLRRRDVYVSRPSQCGSKCSHLARWLFVTDDEKTYLLCEACKTLRKSSFWTNLRLLCQISYLHHTTS